MGDGSYIESPKSSTNLRERRGRQRIKNRKKRKREGRKAKQAKKKENGNKEINKLRTFVNRAAGELNPNYSHAYGRAQERAILACSPVDWVSPTDYAHSSATARLT